MVGTFHECFGARWTATFALLLLSSACGGRVSHPVAATNPYDGRLTCDHLRAEKAVNEAKIADLRGERGDAERNSAGMLLVSPLMVDVSHSESNEIDALVERNKTLKVLMDQKKCQSTPEGATP